MAETAVKEEQIMDIFTEEEENAKAEKYLLFSIGEEIYGIEIGSVTEIIELQKITTIPRTPKYVKGVINLRGKVIPIMDLRIRFDMESREYDDRTCIIVVNINEIAVGLIVDRVSEVIDIPETGIEPAPDFKSGNDAGKFISGLGKVEDGVKILINVQKLLYREDLESLKGITEKQDSNS